MNKRVLVDDDEIIMSEEHLVSEEPNNFIKKATKSLQINQDIMNPFITDEQTDITDRVIKAINKYKYHPNILLINSKLSSPESIQ